MESLEDTLRQIEIDQAIAILREAKRGGHMDEDIPAASEEIEEASRYWVEEAWKGYEQGMRDETVLAILRIVDSGLLDVMQDEVYDETPENYLSVSETIPKPIPGATDPIDTTEWRRIVSSEIIDREAWDKATTRLDRVNIVDKDLAAEYNLPVPKDFEDEPVDMPHDLSGVNDREIRRLSGIYNGYLARTKYLLGLELSNLAQATHLRDAAYREAFKNVRRVDPATDKAKLKEVMDAEAREDETFEKLDSAVLEHQKKVTVFKALVDIYSGNVDRLSRDWTMRQNEWEKTQIS